jgi:hypothetical protein
MDWLLEDTLACTGQITYSDKEIWREIEDKTIYFINTIVSSVSVETNYLHWILNGNRNMQKHSRNVYSWTFRI